MAVGLYLPFSPVASALGFVALPHLYWVFLLGTLACYMVLTQAVKAWLLKKAWA
jgi:Mg2+-importing ATPase